MAPKLDPNRFQDPYARLRRAGVEFIEALIAVVSEQHVHSFQRACASSPPQAVAVASVGKKTAQALKKVVSGADSSLGKCELAILRALVQRRPKASTRTQIAILSGYSKTSGGFAQALAKLRVAKLIEDVENGMFPTEAGVLAAGDVKPIPSGPDRISYWCGQLDPCAGAILNAMAQNYPNEVNRNRLSLITGYSSTSGGFAQALAKLRALGLIDGYRASRELME